MIRPEVLVDVHGILLNFVHGYLELIKDALGKTYLPEEVTEYDIPACLGLAHEEQKLIDLLVSEPGFAESLPVYEGAREGLEKLQRVASVFIVTSPWDDSPTWEYETKHFLRKHFDISLAHIINAHAKYQVAGDFLVDDKAKHLRAWHARHPNGRGVHWMTPHNRNEDWRFGLSTNNWEELCAYVTYPRPNLR